MSDYIGREALVERLGRNFAACNPGTFSELCYADAIETVKHFPAADVEPVRHVPRKVWSIDEYYGEWLRCPNCGYEDNTVNAKYCGGCGSKMDLEGENNDN